MRKFSIIDRLLVGLMVIAISSFAYTADPDPIPNSECGSAPTGTTCDNVGTKYCVAKADDSSCGGDCYAGGGSGNIVGAICIPKEGINCPIHSGGTACGNRQKGTCREHTIHPNGCECLDRLEENPAVDFTVPTCDAP